MRNLPEPDPTLRALRELLRPGGVLAVHEYSLEPGRYARAVWTAVCWTVIIPGGRLLSGRADLYRYLWRSVLDFDDPARFLDRLADAGFAAWGFISGPLAAEPRRVGAPLRQPFEGQYRARRGEYRVRYMVDDDHRVVSVLDVEHRRNVYRA